MRNIGLVLSGGMAKGAYQVGALRAVSEWIQPSDFLYVSAASIGVLNAYAFLTDQLDAAEKLWRDSTTDNYSVLISSLLRSAFVQSSIRNIISDQPIENRFFIPLLDFTERTLSYFDLNGVSSKEEIENYLNASVALPIFNTGVSINGTLFFDGAMVDNIPVFPLVDKELDYIILLYFDNQDMIFESKEFDDKIIKLTFPDPSLRSSLKLTYDEVVRTTALGYQRSKSVLKYVFQNGIDDKQAITDNIKKLNDEFPTRKVYLSGDILVAQMNKVVKKLAHRKVISDDKNTNGHTTQRQIISANSGLLESAAKGGRL